MTTTAAKGDTVRSLRPIPHHDAGQLFIVYRVNRKSVSVYRTPQGGVPTPLPHGSYEVVPAADDVVERELDDVMREQIATAQPCDECGEIGHDAGDHDEEPTPARVELANVLRASL